MSSFPEVVIKIFASNPPSILFALGFVLILWGFATDNSGMVNAGWGFVGIGVILQVLWLVLRR